jgi:hypothetical protein
MSVRRSGWEGGRCQGGQVKNSSAPEFHTNKTCVQVTAHAATLFLVKVFESETVVKGLNEPQTSLGHRQGMDQS